MRSAAGSPESAISTALRANVSETDRIDRECLQHTHQGIGIRKEQFAENKTGVP
jgi:hypothetical protein